MHASKLHTPVESRGRPRTLNLVALAALVAALLLLTGSSSVIRAQQGRAQHGRAKQRRPAIKLQTPNKSDLTGIWRRTVAHPFHAVVIRECQFYPNGKVTSLDYIPGLKHAAGAPLIGLYRYERDVIEIDFLNVAHKDRCSIKWLRDNVIQSTTANSLMLGVWTRQ